MIKNTNKMNDKKSSKHEDRVRSGGSNFGGHSAKGIKHGIGGRHLHETEHSDRMDHEVEMGES